MAKFNKRMRNVELVREGYFYIYGREGLKKCVCGRGGGVPQAPLGLSWESGLKVLLHYM